MWQQLQIIGNLGKEPEMRYLPSGSPVTTLSVAANHEYTNKAGAQVKETIWVRVSVFGPAAEACNEYLHTGRQVFVQGRLKGDPATGAPRIWTGDDQKSHTSFEMVADFVKWLGTRGDSSGAAPKEQVVHGSNPEVVGAEEDL